MDDRHVRYSWVELAYAENTVDWGEFSQAVDELSKDFASVQVTRRFAGPMASPLFGDAAIAFIIGAGSSAFLSELTKDIYKTLKAGLFRLYSIARAWANNRGYIKFAIEVVGEYQSGLPQTVHFSLPDGMSEAEFVEALVTLPDALREAIGGRMIEMRYEKDQGWQTHQVVS